MLKKTPDNLNALRRYKQFILWRPEPQPDGSVKKLPVNPLTGMVCDAHGPSVWMSADDVERAAEFYDNKHGIAFVFTENDPFFFLDLDGCLLPDGSGWNNNALWIVQQFPGAAVEVSQSGRGLHIFGQSAPAAHKCDNPILGASLFTSKRFVALTGWNVIGSAGIDFTDVLTRLIPEYWPPGPSLDTTQWTTEPIPEWNGYDDDAVLIQHALHSKSGAGVFGGRATFKDLWTANEKKLSQSFPDSQGVRAYDASAVDAALAQHLAFWTGKDCERIERLMRQSALVRDKWDLRDDYLRRTILKAVAQQSQVFTAGPLKQLPTPPPDLNPQLMTGFQFMSAQLQLEYFKGCVYIQDVHKIFTPSGALLKSEQFNTYYSGFLFQLDAIGDKTTKKAWEAFAESQVVRWPKADCKCFRPELKPGALIKENGKTLVNIYVPVHTKKIAGDPAPFILHLTKMLPNERDREILLSYMAACIQHKGVKFQWAPLLQGVEGNGKTLCTRCVAHAIGPQYTHLPMAVEIAEKFNEWLFEKLFIGIEDIHVPNNRVEIIEVLKPMITNEMHAMRAMQQSQVMRDNRANFIINSNHKDAIRKTRNDRRFCVFYTAQQTAEDLIRDGMSSSYFPDLYNWLKFSDGYAIVNNFLENYQINPKFNPAGECQRAPRTSSTDEAILAGLGYIEQEIMEAVEEGRPGFCGGWISSVAVERLLSGLKISRSVPPNKRRELLQSLGYDWHPALKDGRVNNPIMIDDGKKPRLFIKAGHLAANLTSPSEISRIYQETQGIIPNNYAPDIKNMLT